MRGQNRPPSGIPAPSTGSSTTSPQTTHIVNTAWVACHATLQPSGRYHFVASQYCKTCGKPAVKHVPGNCLELPANAGRKAVYALQNSRGKKKNAGE